jgi:hypothetical protein
MTDEVGGVTEVRPEVVGFDVMAELALDPGRYESERFDRYRDFYNNKADHAKWGYLGIRVFSVVAGGAVPILVNLDIPGKILGYPAPRALVTLLSFLVMIALSLEKVFHYGEQWKNYLSTEQKLWQERSQFHSRIGEYSGLDDARAFSLFVEKVEGAIRWERRATLNAMTMAAEGPDDSKRATVADGKR